jgi:hypothetical protein
LKGLDLGVLLAVFFCLLQNQKKKKQWNVLVDCIRKNYSSCFSWIWWFYLLSFANWLPTELAQLENNFLLDRRISIPHYKRITYRE